MLTQVNFAGSQENNSSIQDTIKKRNSFAIELSGSMLPKANIKKIDGSYGLKSDIQSSYELGALYIHQISSGTKIITGVHVVVGKRNYYSYIPASDFPSSMNITNELFIENKFTWSRFRVPVILEKTLASRINKRGIDFAFGFDCSFAFKSTFEGETHNVVGSNGQSIRVLETDIASNNSGKPWINYLVGISKIIDKRGNFSLGLNANFSSAYFIKGTYLFTIPGKPNSSGTYRINGSGISLRVRYELISRRN